MGVDSSAALSIRSQLGGLYMDAGSSAKADELLTACLPRLEALFGIGHGFTITAASNLAMLRLFHYYKPQAAIDIAQRFEEPSSKKYGPDHSTTLRLRCVQQARRSHCASAR